MNQRLPVEDVFPELGHALSTGTRAVLAAPPGAGKTTRVPLFLLRQPWLDGQRIVALEPRRLAARGAAERLAAQLGEKVGETVGYRIRGETVVGEKTRLEIVTEGVLTRMLQSDPELSGIGCVVFDEVHERSINTDLGLALCIEVQQALRPDLRLLAMSATLDTAAFGKLLDDCPLIESAGRMFPVETRWLDRPWRASERSRPVNRHRQFIGAMEHLIREAAGIADGDILAFLPGAREIADLTARLTDALPDLTVRPLYGAMNFKNQRAALVPEPGGRRRIVLATSIAETSLTVPGVRIVVDSGLSRRARVDTSTALSRLITVPVSRAEADQRRGRAGRLAPGHCFRLWTRGEEGAMAAFPPPEIHAADLAPLALELAQWGVDSPAELQFIDAPKPEAYAAARALISDLGAIDSGGRITPHGTRMATLPLHPRLAHMVETGRKRGLEGEAALIAALISERDPLRGAARGNSDLRDRIAAVTGQPVQGAEDAT
ncbi:MAG: ATP-dependent helicase HrpB, partial [Pseudomonadota bacterium]